MRTKRKSLTNAESLEDDSSSSSQGSTGVRVLVALALVLAAAALVIPRFFLTTPDEVEAALSVPPVPPVTVEVEMRSIRVESVSRGTVEFVGIQDVVLPALPGLAGSIPIVTSSRPGGDRLTSGDVLLEVSYRPVFVLEGETPLVRDLATGSSGPDVEMLQAALESLGFLDAGDVDGRFGSATRVAIAGLYEEAGYAAPLVGRRVFAPISELWITPDTDIAVREMASVGERLTRGESVGTISTPELLIVTRVWPREASEISVGDSVAILDETTGETQEAKISSISPTPDVDTNLVAVTIAVDTMFAADRDYRITIVLNQSDGEVLAVPETAIYSGSGGATYLLRMVNGRPERIDVTVGIVGLDGFAEIILSQSDAPKAPNGALQAGDVVLIGPVQ